MTSEKLYRLSGLAGIIGGVLFASNALAILEASLLPGEFLGMNHAGAQALFYSTGLIGTIFMVLAMTGIYLRQYAETGRMGLVSFVLVITGLLGFTGEFSLNAFMIHYIEEVGAAMDALATSPRPVLSIVTIIAIIAGLLLFSISTWRAGVLPRWAGWTMLAGPVLTFAFLILQLPDYLSVAAPLLLGLGMVWFGADLLVPSTSPEPAAKTGFATN